VISPNVIPEWRPEIRKYVQGDEIVVPPGKYFAMGDNRDHSQDSRYWGFVDRDAIMGAPFWFTGRWTRTSGDYSGRNYLLVALDGHFSDPGSSAVAHAMEPHAPHRALAVRSRGPEPVGSPLPFFA